MARKPNRAPLRAKALAADPKLPDWVERAYRIIISDKYRKA